MQPMSWHKMLNILSVLKLKTEPRVFLLNRPASIGSQKSQKCKNLVKLDGLMNSVTVKIVLIEWLKSNQFGLGLFLGGYPRRSGPPLP